MTLICDEPNIPIVFDIKTLSRKIKELRPNSKIIFIELEC